MTSLAAIWRGDDRWRAAALVAMVLVLCGMKSYYRHASAGELSWILAPTAWLVSLVSGVGFAFEAGAGWVSREARFIIAPACAGVNFVLAAFLALSMAWLPGIRSAGSAARRLAGAFAVAFAAALVVNTIRIVIAIALHNGTIDTGGLDPAQVHRAEGIAIYLGGLCLLYALARALDRRRARSGDALAH